MKRKLISFLILSLVFTGFGYGQEELSVYRISGKDLTGTARGMSMGGAFGALGADVTGVAINPAGIGVYRSSEVVATMDFSSSGIKTDWQGTSLKDNKFKFSFDNLALMCYFPIAGSAIKAFNYGFSYNRLKNFDKNYTAQTNAVGASLTDYIALKATSDGMNPDQPSYDQNQWLNVLGYNGYMIDYDEKNGNYYPGFTGDPRARLAVSEKGAIDSYDFTGGVNIEDMLYLGVTFSLTDVDYRMRSIYSEDFQNGGYDLRNSWETSGSGYKVALGAIFRPIDALRLGVAYHSPTWYNMTDFGWGEISSDRMDPQQNPASSPDKDFDYKIQTPYRWVFSAAGIIGTSAIISLDYEISDYSGMKLKDADGREFYNNNPNPAIKNDFQLSSEIRAGIEYRVVPELSVRAGYAWKQSPLKDDFRNGRYDVYPTETVPHYVLEGDTHHVTFGLGYRFTPHFYADAAFVYKIQKSDLYAFSKIVDQEEGKYTEFVDYHPAKFNNESIKGILTLGYKF